MLNFLRRLFKRDIVFFKNDKGKTVDFAPSSDSDTNMMLGPYAEALLGNPALDAALKKSEQSLIATWKRSARGDTQAREYIYYEIQALASVRLMLNGIVNNMVLDQKAEDQKNKIESAKQIE